MTPEPETANARLEAARKEYDVLFRSGDNTLAATKAIAGGLRASKLRGICWRVFLNVLPVSESEDTWVAISCAKRAEYAGLKERHLIDPHAVGDGTGEESMDVDSNNPLSGSEESPWARFFELDEQKKEIDQDLERIYPEFEFFQSSGVRETMSRILLLWSVLNPAIGYRQGMHELLGPILLTLHTDAIDCSGLNVNTEAPDHPVDSLLAMSHLEADAFTLYSSLMMTMKEYFVVSKGGSGDLRRPGASDDPKVAPVLRASCRVYHEMLKKYDLELYNHLEKNDVEPQIFLLRWIRLLFGREFHLEDVLPLWDAMFAEDGRLDDLLELVCVAMIKFIREDLLSRRQHQVLMRIMKYPPVESTTIFVEHALQLRAPARVRSPPASAQNKGSTNAVVSAVKSASNPAAAVATQAGHLAAKAASGVVDVLATAASAALDGGHSQASASRARASSSTASARANSKATLPQRKRHESRPGLVASNATNSQPEPKQQLPSVSEGGSVNDHNQVAEDLANNVFQKIEDAIDILEDSLDFDNMVKAGKAVSSLRAIQQYVSRWRPGGGSSAPVTASATSSQRVASSSSQRLSALLEDGNSGSTPSVSKAQAIASNSDEENPLA